MDSSTTAQHSPLRGTLRGVHPIPGKKRRDGAQSRAPVSRRASNIQNHMEPTTSDIPWLCIISGIVLFSVITAFGMLSRWRYARRFWKAYARGAFAGLNTPEVKSRMHRLSVVALIGVIGMILSVVVLIVQQASGFLRAYSDVTLIVAAIFAVTTIIAALLRQREFDRRL